MLTKTLSTFAATAIVATFAATAAADAGGCGRYGGARAYQSAPSASYAALLRAKRQAQARRMAALKAKQIAAQRALAARKQRAAVAVAKAEVAPEPAKDVTKTSMTAAETKVAVATTECKRFVPAAGTTVTVDCDQK